MIFLFDVKIVVGLNTYPIKKIEKVIDTTIVNELAATKARKSTCGANYQGPRTVILEVRNYTIIHYCYIGEP